MAGGKLKWDAVGERYYETGVKNGVLYVQGTDGTYGEGVAWNGLTAFTKSPEGAEETPLYADDIKYVSLYSAEEFKFTIEAYQSPEEFDVCDGTAEIAKGVTIGQQKRNAFGFVCKTTYGNDVEHNDYGYKLQIVYGATASPSEKPYATINDSPEAITMSWECSTTPVPVPGFKPTACIEINSTTANKTKLEALETILFGKDPTSAGGGDGVAARLPLPEEIITIMGDATPQG